MSLPDPSFFDIDYTLTLSAYEASSEKLMRPLEPGDWGGNQTFAHELQTRLKGRTLTMTGAELDRAFRYAWAYGRGTWQDDYFKPIVSAGLRAGWKPPTSSDDVKMQAAIYRWQQTRNQ